jgi:hypothetical protein
MNLVLAAPAPAATPRLAKLIAGGGHVVTRVPCSSRLGTEGTSACNHGRLCARLMVQGRDVGTIPDLQGLGAAPFLCVTGCPAAGELVLT